MLHLTYKKQQPAISINLPILTAKIITLSILDTLLFFCWLVDIPINTK